MAGTSGVSSNSGISRGDQIAKLFRSLKLPCKTVPSLCLQSHSQLQDKSRGISSVLFLLPWMGLKTRWKGSFTWGVTRKCNTFPFGNADEQWHPPPPPAYPSVLSSQSLAVMLEAGPPVCLSIIPSLYCSSVLALLLSVANEPRSWRRKPGESTASLDASGSATEATHISWHHGWPLGRKWLCFTRARRDDVYHFGVSQQQYATKQNKWEQLGFLSVSIWEALYTPNGSEAYKFTYRDWRIRLKKDERNVGSDCLPSFDL